MSNELDDFYQAWSKDRAWLIDYDNEVAGRKVDTLLSKIPELQNLGIKSVIDFGCGYGKTLSDLHQRLALERAYGFDVTDNAISYAQANFSAPGLSFHKLPTLNIGDNVRAMESAVKNRVDAILLVDVLEHVPDCNRLLINLSKLTKYFVVMVPLEDNVFDNYVIRNKPYPSTRHYNGHVREFNVNSVHYFIRKIGLTPIAEGFETYCAKDCYPPQLQGQFSYRFKRGLTKWLRFILASLLPKKIYLRLIGLGRYYCVATFDQEHILFP